MPPLLRPLALLACLAGPAAGQLACGNATGQTPCDSAVWVDGQTDSSLMWAFPFCDARTHPGGCALVDMNKCSMLGGPVSCGGHLVVNDDTFIRTGHAPTGQADLDHAVAICDAHAYPTFDVPGSSARWFYDIAGCSAIIELRETDDMRHAAEAMIRKQEADDKAFVEQFAKGLPK